MITFSPIDCCYMNRRRYMLPYDIERNERKYLANQINMMVHAEYVKILNRKFEELIGGVK